MRRIIILIAALLVTASPVARADVNIKGGSAAVTDLDGTVTIDGGGTLAGAQIHCQTYELTSEDGDVVTDTAIISDPFYISATLYSADAYVGTTGGGSNIIVDVENNGSTVFSSALILEPGENHDRGTDTFSDTNIDAQDVLSWDVTADSSNTGAGLKGKLCWKND